MTSRARGARHALVPQGRLWHNRGHSARRGPSLMPHHPPSFRRRPSGTRLLRGLLAALLLCGALFAVPAARHGPGRGDLPRGACAPWASGCPTTACALDVNVWYPTNWTPRELRFPPWRVEAARNSDAVAGRFPLIVLSPPFGRHPFLLSRYGGLAGRTRFRGGGPHACPRLHAQHGSAAYLAAVRRPPERGEHPHRPAAAA